MQLDRFVIGFGNFSLEFWLQIVWFSDVFSSASFKRNLLSKTILITCLLTKYLLKSYLHQIRHRRDFPPSHDYSSLGTQKFVYTLAF